MAWALPIVTAIVLISAEIGLVQVAAMMAMVPLVGVILVVALLVFAGIAPRRRLARTGWSTVPASGIPVLVLHWGFVIAGILTYDSEPERGGRPSFVQQLTGAAVAPWTAWVMFALALVAWLASCVVLAEPKRTHAARRSTIVASGIAVLVVAAAVAVAPIITSAADAEVRDAEALLVDADGRTPVEVAALTSAEQAEIVVAHFERTQQVSSQARGLIAADGWLYRGNIDGGVAAVFNERERPCDTDNFDCYGVFVSFRYPQRLTDIQLDALVEPLRAAGWDGAAIRRDEVWEFDAVNADGYELSIGQYAYDDEVLVTVRSPHWWGRGEDVIRSMNSTDPAPADGTVTWAATEWPAIDEK